MAPKSIMWIVLTLLIFSASYVVAQDQANYEFLNGDLAEATILDTLSLMQLLETGYISGIWVELVSGECCLPLSMSSFNIEDRTDVFLQRGSDWESAYSRDNRLVTQVSAGTDSIKIVNVSPAPGTRIRVGDTVTFNITVEYSLYSSSFGWIWVALGPELWTFPEADRDVAPGFGRVQTSFTRRIDEKYIEPSGRSIKLTVILVPPNIMDSLTYPISDGSGQPSCDITGFSVHPTSLNVGEEATITGTIANIGTASGICNWDLRIDNSVIADDGEFLAPGESLSISKTYLFDTAGTYEVKLSISPDRAEWQTVTVAQANQSPRADFDWNPRQPEEGQSVRFTDRSTDPDGYISSWRWDFGDGSTSTAQNPSHTYSSAGTYTACLTVWDDSGLQDTTCFDITIKVKERPRVRLRGRVSTDTDCDNLYVGTEVITLCQVWVDIETIISGPSLSGSVRVSFESGWTGCVAATIDFDGKGDKVEVSGPYDVSEETIKFCDANDYIKKIKENQLPTARLSASPASVKVGETVTFDASASYDPDGQVVSYYFDFGDGGSSGWGSTSTSRHSYSTPGTYYAKVKVRDNQGAESEWSSSVRVFVTEQNQPPIAKLSASPTSAKVGKDVKFDASASYDPDGTVRKYYFDFGDGNKSGWIPDAMEWHSYSSPGSYYAKVRVEDNQGLVGDWSSTVRIRVEEASDTSPPDTTITSGPIGTIDTNTVTLSWRGSDDRTATSNLVYSYKLEDYDSSWSNWTSSTSRTYSNLPDGSYTFYVKARDEAGNEDPTPASRSFRVSTAQPALQVSPTRLSFSAQEGGSNPSSQSISITNSGAGTLNWKLSTDGSWLSVSRTSGTAPSTVNVSVSISGRRAGTYNGTITVTAPNVQGSPQTVTVTLTITSRTFSPPTIIDVGITKADYSVVGKGPLEADAGERVRLWYLVDNPNSTSIKVFLGASIRSPDNKIINDENDDISVTIETGHSWVSRYFDIPASASRGDYDVAFGLWDENFSSQYTEVWKSNWLTIKGEVTSGTLAEKYDTNGNGILDDDEFTDGVMRDWINDLITDDEQETLMTCWINETPVKQCGVREEMQVPIVVGQTFEPLISETAGTTFGTAEADILSKEMRLYATSYVSQVGSAWRQESGFLGGTVSIPEDGTYEVVFQFRAVGELRVTASEQVFMTSTGRAAIQLGGAIHAIKNGTDTTVVEEVLWQDYVVGDWQRLPQVGGVWRKSIDETLQKSLTVFLKRGEYKLLGMALVDALVITTPFPGEIEAEADFRDSNRGIWLDSIIIRSYESPVSQHDASKLTSQLSRNGHQTSQTSAMPVRVAEITPSILQFSVPSERVVQIKVEIFDLRGQRIMLSGWQVNNHFTWNLNNHLPIANGVYLYVVFTKDSEDRITHSKVGKLIILR